MIESAGSLARHPKIRVGCRCCKPLGRASDKAGIDEREGDHRGRELREKEHVKLVRRIAIGESLLDGSGIALCREIPPVDSEVFGEITDLFLFRFQRTCNRASRG